MPFGGEVAGDACYVQVPNGLMFAVTNAFRRGGRRRPQTPKDL